MVLAHTLIEPDDVYNRALVENAHPPAWVNPKPYDVYNLVVLGAGTAGLVATAGAAALGARVAITEERLMGGNCLNFGCVPSKAVIRASRAAYSLKEVCEFGCICPATNSFNFSRAMERMRRLRAEISANDSVQRFTSRGAQVFLGAARFTAHDTVEVDGLKLRFKKAIVATGGRPAHPEIPGLAEPGFHPEIWLQGEGDLGARLERILSCALKSSPFAIAIGGDTPGLPSDLFEQARAALHVADAVIGPSEDGGFYLLGMRRYPDGLLGGISWSQGCTCQQTLAKLKAAGLTVYLLPAWFDVDRPADLARLQATIADGKIDAPRTREAILRLQSRKAANRALKISVIIPALNERSYLPQAIAHLRQRRWVHELIVVDGGSKDGTREWLAHQTDLKFIESLPGRGRQLNAGAQVATGDALLFLHADCVPPIDAGELLIGAFSSSNVVGGCFPVTFDRRRPLSLQLVAAGMNLWARLTRSGTGDQAIFVRREVFERIGRFRDWPLFEDIDLVTRIKQAGRFVVVSSPVTVSARRHLRYGVSRTVALVYLRRLGFWAGLSPFKLAGWYKAPHPNLKPPPELGVTSELDVVPD